MAIAMRTFGNTLSELQAGTNAAQGLDYQRANAQDAINQARLEAFMRLQGQKFQTQAQQSEQAANRAQRMAELLQQIEANRELTQMDAKSRLDVAKAQAEARGVDPRIYQNFADIQALNQEKQQRFDYLNRLSRTRQELERQKKAMLGNRGFMDYGAPNKGFFRMVDPAWTELEAKFKSLDAEAAKMIDPDTGLGIVVDPDTGGYIIPPFNPIPIPDIPGRPVTAAPVQIPPAGSQVPAMLPRGEVTIGGVPLNTMLSPAPTIPFDTSIPRLRPQGATNRFRWTPDGAVAY